MELWRNLGQKHFDELYAAHMQKVAMKYPGDVNVQILWIDAVVLLTPWEYYEKYSIKGGEKVKESLVSAYTTLQQLVEVDTPHLLALHLWIHITEQSTEPSIGLKGADDLASIMGEDGTSHLIHMPSHTYFRTGRYNDCISSSSKAIKVDKRYKEKCLEPYLPTHNQAMLSACSMAYGDINDILDNDILLPLHQTDPISAIWPSAIFPPPLELVYTRFGMWKQILTLPASGGSLVDTESKGTPYLKAQSLYAHILATLWNNENDDKADIMKMKIEFHNMVQNIAQDALPTNHVFYPYHREIGQLLNLTLLAAYRMKEHQLEEAKQFLESAVELQDSFTYTEPVNHYIPLRQCLTAVLMKTCQKNEQKT